MGPERHTGRMSHHDAVPVPDLRLRLSTSRLLGDASTRGLQRWAVEALPADGAEPIGTISVLSVDLRECEDPWDALDSSNDDIAHIGDVVFDVNTGQLAEGLASRLHDTGDRVLVLDRVELVPAWQGKGVAALLIAETLELMRTGCRAALCLPGPLDRGAEEDYEAGYDEAVRRMTKVWSRVGFRPFAEGVWLLEPRLGTLDETLASLREAHGLLPVRQTA